MGVRGGLRALTGLSICHGRPSYCLQSPHHVLSIWKSAREPVFRPLFERSVACDVDLDLDVTCPAHVGDRGFANTIHLSTRRRIMDSTRSLQTGMKTVFFFLCTVLVRIVQQGVSRKPSDQSGVSLRVMRGVGATEGCRQLV